MKMTKKVLGMVLCGVMTVGMITAVAALTAAQQMMQEIHQQMQHRRFSIVSREDGSGTRGAFIELFGV